LIEIAELSLKQEKTEFSRTNYLLVKDVVDGVPFNYSLEI